MWLRSFLGWRFVEKELYGDYGCLRVAMLERFSMENAKLVSTPLENHFKLSTTQCLRKNDDDV